MSAPTTPSAQDAAPTAGECAARAAAAFTRAQDLARADGYFVQPHMKMPAEVLVDIGRAWMDLGALISVTQAMQPPPPPDERR
jgi:flagellar motor switch/type III secretory pathway protein FliN